MTWAKFDDRCPEHPKIAELTDAQFRAWFEMVCYCARNLTDGQVTEAIARPRWGRFLRHLVSKGVAERTQTGYTVHDYLDWNDSREEVESRKAAGQVGGKARAANAQRIGGKFAPDTSDDTSDTPPAPDQRIAGNGASGSPATDTSDSPALHSAPLLQGLDQEQPPGAAEHEDTKIPAGWSDLEAGLVRKLIDLDKVWAQLGPARINALNRDFGRPVVIEALQHMLEEHNVPSEAYPMLRAVCMTIHAEAQAEVTSG